MSNDGFDWTVTVAIAPSRLETAVGVERRPGWLPSWREDGGRELLIVTPEFDPRLPPPPPGCGVC